MEAKIKILSDNRSAGHDYFLSDRTEAGLVLTGTEVKAARGGHDPAQGRLRRGRRQRSLAGERPHREVFARQPGEPRAGPPPETPAAPSEILKLQETTRERGLTVVPTKLYLKNGRIKVELAVGKGKKFHDKRQSEREREMKSEAKAALGRRGRD